MGSFLTKSSAGLPGHHLDEGLLLDYAAGACGEAEGLAIATHLTLCPECRDRLTELECLGGTMLEELPPVDLEPGSLEALMARLDEPETMAAAEPHPAPADRELAHRASDSQGILLPAPLRAYLGDGIEGVSWRAVTRGIEEAPVGTTAGGAKAKLLRIRAGTKVPAHTHEGSEITVVLSGGFADSRGHFLRGDVAVSDQDVDHSPVADEDEDCICLVVTDAPLKLTGRIGRFLNPFVKF
jgi:putative transcriptional regulator